jgi:NAD(P)-dependent dehydrogenase (short-subunit alcohol dehydrogenase family)
MTRRICVITGAAGGLGAALAERAVHEGYDLVLHGRTEPKLAALRDRLVSDTPELKVEIMVGNLDTAAGARGVAAKITKRVPEIDLLINNAGVLLDGVQMSPDGLEMHTQVNLISPYILMQSLKPNVSRARGAIINVSSGSALRAQDLSAKQLTRPDKAQKLTGSYARSKLALSVITHALGGEFAANNVTLASADPGPNKTGMTSGDGMPAFLLLIRPLIYTPPEKGAEKIFDALRAAESSSQPGAFYAGRKVKNIPEFAQSSETANMLLAFCETQASLSQAA